jgi:hypothetical protein
VTLKRDERFVAELCIAPASVVICAIEVRDSELVRERDRS